MMSRLILTLHLEMPPLKKRRGLAGSIVSTAVSAALIGTAVGLTVYRLWRDRGKEAPVEAPPHEVADPSTQPPPPPYEEAEWKPLPEPAAMKAHSHTPVTPKTVPRKRRPAPVSKRPIAYHSARRSRPTPVVSPAPARSEFDFGRNDEHEVDGTDGHSVVEDKMDWIGDKLTMLIEQGKRALNSEVVVFSEAKEDEVDDGSGSWEEDEFQASRAPSRAGSVRRGKKSKSIAVPSTGAGLGIHGVKATGTSSLSSSPRRSAFANGYTPSLSTASTSTTYASASPGFAPSSLPRPFALDSPGRTHVRGISYESALLPSFSPAREGSSQYESPELRESMDLARAKLLARRAGA